MYGMKALQGVTLVICPTLLLAALVMGASLKPDDDDNFHMFRERRAATSEKSAIWPNAKIPFVIDKLFDPNEVDIIREVLQDWSNGTCIQFIELKDGQIVPKFVYFMKTDYQICYSLIGYQSHLLQPNQNVWVHPGCLKPDNIRLFAHEIGHLLGFYHEHNRPDRDHFIEILWDNIPTFKREQFKKADRDVVTSFANPYDFGSLMQYPLEYNSVATDVPSMKLKVPYLGPIGKNTKPSANDLQQLKHLYKCEPFVPPDEGSGSGASSIMYDYVRYVDESLLNAELDHGSGDDDYDDSLIDPSPSSSSSSMYDYNTIESLLPSVLYSANSFSTAHHPLFTSVNNDLGASTSTGYLSKSVYQSPIPSLDVRTSASDSYLAVLSSSLDSEIFMTRIFFPDISSSTLLPFTTPTPKYFPNSSSGNTITAIMSPSLSSLYQITTTNLLLSTSSTPYSLLSITEETTIKPVLPSITRTSTTDEEAISISEPIPSNTWSLSGTSYRYTPNADYSASMVSLHEESMVTNPTDVIASTIDSSRQASAVISSRSRGEMGDTTSVGPIPSGLPVFKTGQRVGLKMKDSSMTKKNYWLTCTQRNCRARKCPGESFSIQKQEKCTTSIFTFLKPQGGISVIRVGDRVVVVPYHSSSDSAISCIKGEVCKVDHLCYNSAAKQLYYCTKHFMVIAVPNKANGELVVHGDSMQLYPEDVGNASRIICDNKNKGRKCQAFHYNDCERLVPSSIYCKFELFTLYIL